MLKHFPFAALLVLTLAAVSAQQPGDQAPPEAPAATFRSEVNYVQLPIRVVDGRGNFVSGLTQSDFQILEDGKAQKIATFSAVDIPNIPVDNTVPDAPVEAVDPVASNERLDVDGRIYLFVLDDFHLQASYTANVRRLMRGFINEHLSANDLTGLVIASGRSQDFTRNRQLLLDVADRFVAEFDSTDPPDVQRYQREAVIKTLLRMTEWMGSIKGRRKALVLITPTIGCAAMAEPNGCMSDLVEIARTAARSDVSIFGLDPRGLVGTPAANAENSGAGMPGRGAAAIGIQQPQVTDGGPIGSLHFLSESTGGFATVNTNNIEAGFQRIVRENSSYYLIGYYSTNTAVDGKFRKHQVRVNRRGVEVTHRQGYLAPRADRVAPQVAGPGSLGIELRELMKSPLPVTGMSLRFAAAPFLGPDGRSSVSIVVEMPRDTLQFTEEGGRQRITIGVYIGLHDRDGKPVGSDDPNINLDFPLEAGRKVTANGVRISSRISAPPGSYRLWVGGAQSPGGLRGSAMSEISIPDFRKAPLMLSGLAVTSSTGSRMYNARADDLIDQVLGAAPAAHREFSVTGDLWIYGEIYDNRSDAGEVTGSVSVTSSGGGTVFEAPLEPAPVQFGQLARIPLAELGAGSYVATITARSETPKPVSASRAIAFTVK